MKFLIYIVGKNWHISKLLITQKNQNLKFVLVNKVMFNKLLSINDDN